uniref:ST3 beta-galactoside alpha-2,3-sialyltransferase 6 n=1 Tax=Equus caballus TaxID=9796 RepID=A0A9L0RL96_HORSE
MRGYLVAIFLSAIFLYYVLHCISWGTSVYWARPVEMQPRKRSQPCREKPAFASLLRFHEFHPFLCASDFKKIASLYGGDKFSLPYGIKASEEPFRLALSALQSCDLFDEFDTCHISDVSRETFPGWPNSCDHHRGPRLLHGDCHSLMLSFLHVVQYDDWISINPIDILASREWRGVGMPPPFKTCLLL